MSTANVSDRKSGWGLGMCAIASFTLARGRRCDLSLHANAKGTTPASACVPGLICLEVDVIADAYVNTGVMP